MKSYLYRIATGQVQGVFASVVGGVCLCLSWAYGLAVQFMWVCYRLRIFKRAVLARPVISVGNITWGGSGKTPFVRLLATILRNEKINPVVLLRGYMDKEGESDEAVMLQEALEGVRVYTGKNRVRAAGEALQEGPADMFILDDGFQHWRLQRDWDIVLIDATNPFGNGRLIPRGILREPLAALKRAGLFVLTKSDSKAAHTASLWEYLNRIHPGCPVVEAIHKPVGFCDVRNNNSRMDASVLRGQTVCAFSGIADPKSFEESLARTGTNIRRHFCFMDHHAYTKENIDEVIQYCRNHSVAIVVTTQKDAVKMAPFLYRFGKDFQLFSLEIAVEIIKGQNDLLQGIRRLLSR